MLFGPNSSDWSDAFMSHSACAPLSIPAPRMHTSCFTDAGNIKHTPLQKYQVAGEDVHLVTMAEKMQPALLVTAYPSKKARKRKPKAEMAGRNRLWIKKEVRPESTSVRHLSGGDNWGM